MRFMRVGVFVALVAAVSFGIVAERSHAQELPIVTGNNYFPYTDERLPEGGLATMIVRTVFQRMGLNTRVDFRTWDEGYRMALNGDYAATFPYVKTAERAEHFLYSKKLFGVRPILFVSFQNALYINAVEDIIGRTLCVPKGWTIDPYLLKAVSNAKARIYNNTTVLGCFQLLHRGDVDAISVDRRLGMAAARAVSEDSWYKQKRFAERAISNYLMVPKAMSGAETLVARFNQALDELQKEGVIEQITERYFEAYN
jgi:polar amino acid transport system substrate-binding protein